MNLSAVPATLRAWAIGTTNKLTQLERQMTEISRTASALSSRTQRPVASYRSGRITAQSPTPMTDRQDSAYFYPASSGPIVQLLSVTGLVKITLNATAIITPRSVVDGMSGRYNLGVGYSIVDIPNQEFDHAEMRAGDYSKWAIQEIELGYWEAPAKVGREYKFTISATQYATIPTGQHYCRTEYYLAGFGNLADVSFANRTLVVEPI